MVATHLSPYRGKPGSSGRHPMRSSPMPASTQSLLDFHPGSSRWDHNWQLPRPKRPRFPFPLAGNRRRRLPTKGKSEGASASVATHLPPHRATTREFWRIPLQGFRTTWEFWRIPLQGFRTTREFWRIPLQGFRMTREFWRIPLRKYVTALPTGSSPAAASGYAEWCRRIRRSPLATAIGLPRKLARRVAALRQTTRCRWANRDLARISYR